MDDLLLKIRFEALQNNLDQIQCLVKSVKARRQDIEKLGESIRRAGQHLDTVLRTGLELEGHTEPQTFDLPKIDPSLRHLITLVTVEARSIKTVLQELKTKTDRVINRWAPIERVEGSIGQELEEVATKEWKDKIRTNLEMLKSTTAGTLAPAALNALVQEAWDAYTEIMSEQMRTFFSDYVEFLGGLALRDAGLDEGICRVADELIGDYSKVGQTSWDALIIPASQEAVTMTRSIRMGFPEWTIWAVPLTAHELGQLAVLGGKSRLDLQKNSTAWEKQVFKEFPGKSNKAIKNRQHMLVYLADAFATYAMGPAYACSAILLRFKPLSAYVDSKKYPPDAKRAYVILTMLRLMSGKKLKNPPYSATVDRLTTAWHAALARARPSGSLSKDDEAQLEKWCNYMLSQLTSNYPTGLYDGARLNRTRKALDSLLNEPDKPVKLSGTEEGRDVLNAAWELRLEENDWESRQIETHAQELWNLIAEKKNEIPQVPTGRVEAQEGLPEMYTGRGTHGFPIDPGDKRWPKTK